MGKYVDFDIFCIAYKYTPCDGNIQSPLHGKQRNKMEHTFRINC